MKWHTKPRTKKIHEILCAHLRETTNKNKYKRKYKDKPSNEIASLLRILTDKSRKMIVSMREVNRLQ